MTHIFKQLLLSAWLWRYLFFSSLSVVFCAFPTHAETPPAGQVLLKLTDHLALYHITPDEQLTLLADLPNNIGMVNQLDVEWVIPNFKSVVMSPNSTFVAFVAFTETYKTALFLYDINQNRLKQINLPNGIGSIHWSPASDGIVIAPLDEYFNSPIQLNGIYRYDLSSDSLIELANTSEMITTSVLWMTDNRHIVYFRKLADCAIPCFNSADLFMVDRDGGTSTALTHLDTQIPNDTATNFDYCNGEELIWNNEQQRIYYSMSCSDGTDHISYLIYSVTLKQDSRFEADFGSIFPQDAYAEILTMKAVGNTVYVANAAKSSPLINNAKTGYSALRIIRLDHPGLPIIVNEFIYDSGVDRNMMSAQMSPDNHYLAFVRVGHEPIGINLSNFRSNFVAD